MQMQPFTPGLTLTGIMITDAANKGVTAYFAEFPEVIAQGKDLDEAKTNLLEAFGVMLEFKQSEIEYEGDDDDNIIKQSFNLSIS